MTIKQEAEKVSGIYKIVNKINGKYYIGSSNNIHKRWLYHRDDLIKGNHHNQYLQRSWNKYGPDSFDFIIIEAYVPEESLLIVEQKYLNTLEKEKCYNSSMTAGKIEMNKETRQKISESSKGKIISEETKEKLRKIALKQFKNGMPEETKRKLSQLNKGKIMSRGKGWNHTEEAKRKMRQNNKKSQLGIPHTEERKRKISETKKSQNLKGHSCPFLNKTIYKFQNIKTNEIFEGIQFDFYTKYNLSNGNLANVIGGKRKSVKGWILIK